MLLYDPLPPCLLESEPTTQKHNTHQSPNTNPWLWCRACGARLRRETIREWAAPDTPLCAVCGIDTVTDRPTTLRYIAKQVLAFHAFSAEMARGVARGSEPLEDWQAQALLPTIAVSLRTRATPIRAYLDQRQRSLPVLRATDANGDAVSLSEGEHDLARALWSANARREAPVSAGPKRPLAWVAVVDPTHESMQHALAAALALPNDPTHFLACARVGPDLFGRHTQWALWERAPGSPPVQAMASDRRTVLAHFGIAAHPVGTNTTYVVFLDPDDIDEVRAQQTLAETLEGTQTPPGDANTPIPPSVLHLAALAQHTMAGSSFAVIVCRDEVLAASPIARLRLAWQTEAHTHVTIWASFDDTDGHDLSPDHLGTLLDQLGFAPAPPNPIGENSHRPSIDADRPLAHRHRRPFCSGDETGGCNASTVAVHDLATTLRAFAGLRAVSNRTEGGAADAM